jgi:hypothetical protein
MPFLKYRGGGLDDCPLKLRQLLGVSVRILELRDVVDIVY